ncbi:hypothetical protein [Idiomarina sp. ST10R2A5]|uniref:hypothetical protein n=1 Tax=Idiomarina sp. ST10R2A5 TaxID=3418368 RepID=UPI003EC80CA2
MMDEFVEKGFTNLRELYENSMSVFRPCKPGGEVLEQNLVTAFLMGCLKNNPDIRWGVEIPFASADKEVEFSSIFTHNQTSDLIENDVLKKNWKNHIDAFIYVNGTLYLIEAKRDYPAASFLEKIKADYERIQSPELAISFRLMMNRTDVYSESFGEIKQVKGILLADTWRPTNLNLWNEAYYKPKGRKQAYDLSWLESMERRFHCLGFKSQTASESYSLLIAQTSDLESSRKIINNEL